MYSRQYHVVWCVKYRRKVLTAAVAERLLELLNDVARDNGFEIVESNGGGSCPSAAQLQTAELHTEFHEGTEGCFDPASDERIRLRTAKQTMGQASVEPELFIATVSDRTREQITAYIRSQQEK